MSKQLLITQLEDGILVEDALLIGPDTVRISIKLPLKDYRLAELQADIWEKAARIAQEWSRGVRELAE
jgi:hypothetical protein